MCDVKSILNPEAKFIDGCNEYSNGGGITVKSWTITNPVTNEAIIGGFAPEGKGCWRFAKWTKWAPYLAQYGYNFFNPQDQEISNPVNQTESFDFQQTQDGKVEDLY